MSVGSENPLWAASGSASFRREQNDCGFRNENICSARSGKSHKEWVHVPSGSGIMIWPIRGRVTVTCGKVLTCLVSLAKGAVQRHREVGDSLREAVGQLWKRLPNLFLAEFMHMQVKVSQTVHRALRDAVTHNSVL